jgi:hypothetical protein
MALGALLANVTVSETLLVVSPLTTGVAVVVSAFGSPYTVIFWTAVRKALLGVVSAES